MNNIQTFLAFVLSGKFEHTNLYHRVFVTQNCSGFKIFKSNLYGIDKTMYRFMKWTNDVWISMHFLREML